MDHQFPSAPTQAQVDDLDMMNAVIDRMVALRREHVAKMYGPANGTTFTANPNGIHGVFPGNGNREPD